MILYSRPPRTLPDLRPPHIIGVKDQNDSFIIRVEVNEEQGMTC
jgi:hypothetical protein